MLGMGAETPFGLLCPKLEVKGGNARASTVGPRGQWHSGNPNTPPIKNAVTLDVFIIVFALLICNRTRHCLWLL